MHKYDYYIIHAFHSINISFRIYGRTIKDHTKACSLRFMCIYIYVFLMKELIGREIKQDINMSNLLGGKFEWERNEKSSIFNKYINPITYLYQ